MAYGVSTAAASAATGVATAGGVVIPTVIHSGLVSVPVPGASADQFGAWLWVAFVLMIMATMTIIRPIAQRRRQALLTGTR